MPKHVPTCEHEESVSNGRSSPRDLRRVRTHDEHDEHGCAEPEEQAVRHTWTHGSDEAGCVARRDDVALQGGPAYEPAAGERAEEQGQCGTSTTHEEEKEGRTSG